MCHMLFMAICKLVPRHPGILFLSPNTPRFYLSHYPLPLTIPLFCSAFYVYMEDSSVSFKLKQKAPLLQATFRDTFGYSGCSWKALTVVSPSYC